MYSLFHRLLIKQYRIKNIWSPPGIEPRTACIAHKHSPTELQQPASKQTLQFCVYTVELLCYTTVSLSTDQWKFFFFQRFLLFIEFFYSSNLSLHNFFFFFSSLLSMYLYLSDFELLCIYNVFKCNDCKVWNTGIANTKQKWREERESTGNSLKYIPGGREGENACLDI